MKQFTKKYPFNIQFFAEDPNSGSEGSGGNPNNEGNDFLASIDAFLKTGKAEDILNHPSLKSVLDSRIGTATNTAIANARKKWDAEQNENLSEAEKLAKMTKDEKERYQFKKEQEKLASERLQFEHEKLIVEAAKQLSTEGIDPTLADFIVGKDADETSKRMDNFKKVFNAAVEAAVDSKLKGGKPIKKAPEEGKDDELQKVLKAMKGFN